MSNQPMKNLHQQHFEDLCLTGDLSVLDFFDGDYEVSLKLDGSPALVFGTEPSTGKFVIGTKSLFNKIKKKICYCEEDIILHYGHQPKVAEILIACFRYLPRIDGLLQADFLGFSGSDTYQPNTITYKFLEVITQKIILAPHTLWHTETELKDAVVVGSAPLFLDTDDVKFVQPVVDFIRPQMPDLDVSDVKFLTDKEAAEAKKSINALIRSNEEITWWKLGEILGCMNLAHLYLTMQEIKEDLMEMMIVTDSPKAYIGEEEIVGEGFVLKNDKMIMKLVDRSCFSRLNFLQNSWK
jgi:hypothetical protein